MRKLLSIIAASVLCFATTPVLAQSATPVVTAAPGAGSPIADGQATSPRTDSYGRLWVDVAGGFVSMTAPSPNNNTFAVTSNSAVGGSLTVVGSGTPTLFLLNVVSGASAGFVLVFNGTVVPADGAVTPKLCYTLPANSTFNMPPSDRAYFSGGGVTIVFSTTGCFTKTISNTAFIAAVAF